MQVNSIIVHFWVRGPWKVSAPRGPLPHNRALAATQGEQINSISFRQGYKNWHELILTLSAPLISPAHYSSQQYLIDIKTCSDVCELFCLNVSFCCKWTGHSSLIWESIWPANVTSISAPRWLVAQTKHISVCNSGVSSTQWLLWTTLVPNQGQSQSALCPN